MGWAGFLMGVLTVLWGLQSIQQEMVGRVLDRGVRLAVWEGQMARPGDDLGVEEASTA